MFKKIISHSLLYALGPQLPNIINIFLLPITTKYLTTNDYAVYGITMAYIAALSAVKDLGLQINIVNYYYKAKGNTKRWKPFWQRIFGFLLLLNFPYILLLSTFMIIFIQKYIDSNFILFLALIITPHLFFDTVSRFGFSYFQYRQKPTYPFIIAITTGIISICLNYYLIVHKQLHYWSFFITTSVSSVLTFLFYLYPVFFKLKLLPSFAFKKTQLKNFLKVSLPLVPHSYSAYLLNASDRIVLDLYKIKDQLIGQYNFAYSFGNYAEAGGTAVGFAVGPMYLDLFSRRNEEGIINAKYLTYFLQVLFLLFFGILALWMKEIFYALSSNAELSAAYPLAIIILMGYVYRPMYWACINRLGFEEKTNVFWRVSFVGGVINILLNILFIPFFGVMGSAIATFISLLFIGFYGFYTKEYKKLNAPNYFPNIWIIIITFFAIGVYVVKDVNIPLKLILTTLLVTVALLYLFKQKNHFSFLIRKK